MRKDERGLIFRDGVFARLLRPGWHALAGVLEETAAIRSQANTARIFESSPTLMRLRELEVLEKVAEKAQLSVVVGEGGLADRVVKLL